MRHLSYALNKIFFFIINLNHLQLNVNIIFHFLLIVNARRRLLSELISEKRGIHGFGLHRIDLAAERYQDFVNRNNEPGIA